MHPIRLQSIPKGKAKARAKESPNPSRGPQSTSPQSVLQRQPMESRYALLSTNGFVDSEDLALAASGDTTCVTSRDAISPSHTMSAVTPKSDRQPFAVEICCGLASLSRSLIEAGFSVLAVDHVMHDPQVPVTLLDLTEASHQKILNLN